jgi:hypothetical protein
MRTPSTSVPGLSGLRSLRPLDTRMLEHDVNTQVGHVSGFPNFAMVAKFIHHAKKEGDKAIIAVETFRSRCPLLGYCGPKGTSVRSIS